MTEQEEFEFRHRLEQEGKKTPAQQLAADREEYNPTKGNSFAQNALIGVGRGMSSIGRALSFAPQSEVDEAKRLDAPLLATRGGKVGNVAGQVALAAPLAFVPGANTLAGASLAGAGFGGLTTEGGLQDRAIGAAAGGLGGAAGVGVGKGLGWAAQRYADKQLAAQTANAGKDAAAVSAKNAGYTLPPTEVNPNMLNSMLEGLSGKIKTSQSASAKNQPVTNELAANALGLVPGQQITPQALQTLRTNAGQAYDAVASSGVITPGPAYTAALDKITAPAKLASQGFPNAKANPLVAEIESLKSPQFDASAAVAKIKSLRADADTAYAGGNKELGKALKSGADALEDAIDAHLTKIAAPGNMLKDFREARQLIAKSYSVEKALNPATGDVSAKVLANQLQRGKPLSNELRTIAETGTAFPKATQSLAQNYNAMSPLDYLGGMVSAGATGPLGAAAAVARPAVRSALLSKPYQAMNKGRSYDQNALLEMLANNRALPVLGVSSPPKQ